MKKIYKIVIENKKLKMIKESNEKPVRPKSKQELVKIIKEFIDKNGKKANLNFIDTSLITDMSNIFSIPFCRFLMAIFQNGILLMLEICRRCLKIVC